MEPKPIRVTVAKTNLSRFYTIKLDLMAPDSTLELCIDDAGLERIGVSLTKKCKRSCCEAPTQLTLLGTEAA